MLRERGAVRVPSPAKRAGGCEGPSRAKRVWGCAADPLRREDYKRKVAGLIPAFSIRGLFWIQRRFHAVTELVWCFGTDDILSKKCKPHPSGPLG